MTEIGLWIAIAGLAVTIVGAWVRLNAQIAKMDTKLLADKSACDASFALLRVEVVAVERRAEVSIQGVVAQLKPQLTRIEERVDRLLERHV